MKLGISEILTKAAQFDTDGERIVFLRKHDSKCLRTVLVAALDPNVKWIVPENIDYKPNRLIDQEPGLYKDYRLFYLFMEGGHPGLDQHKREKLYTELLESISAADARLVNSYISRKRMPFPELTAELFNRAFPGLIDTGTDETQIIAEVKLAEKAKVKVTKKKLLEKVIPVVIKNGEVVGEATKESI